MLTDEKPGWHARVAVDACGGSCGTRRAVRVDDVQTNSNAFCLCSSHCGCAHPSGWNTHGGTSAATVARIRTDNQHEHMRVRHAQGVGDCSYVNGS